MPKRERLSALGEIYYIRSAQQSAVKIGFTDNLGMRLANLQTGNPAPLELMWTQRATRGAEELIHRFLKPFSIGREWYPDDGLPDRVLDELGYELVDRAIAIVEEHGGDYLEIYEQQHLTVEDVKAVIPSLVEEHASWIAEGCPEDPWELEPALPLPTCPPSF